MPNNEQVLVGQEFLQNLKDERDFARAALMNQLGQMEERDRWKPIAEMHEDDGLCIVMNMLEDGGEPDFSNILDEFHEENVVNCGWSHFRRFLLTTKEVMAIREAAKAVTGGS